MESQAQVACSVGALRAAVQRRLKEIEHASIPQDALSLWVKLLEDDESTDVELRGKDGNVRTHALLLRTLSEPMKAMLTHNMLESRSKVIDMADYSMDELYFFLRVAYTGRLQDDDLVDVCADPMADCRVDLSVHWQNFSRGVEGWCTQSEKQDFKIKRSTRLQKMMDAYAALHSIAPGQVVFLIEVEGTKYMMSPSDTLASLGIADINIAVEAIPSYAWISFPAACEALGPSRLPSCVKLDLLMAGASLANKYLVPGLLRRFTEHIKLQLDKANFDSVMSFSIKENFNNLQYFCTRFAELDPAIKGLHTQGKLSPVVADALADLWPEQGRFKRLRGGTSTLIL